MSTQPLLNLFAHQPVEVHAAALVALLQTTHRWWTRAELVEHFGWSERDVRYVVAEAGADIVKGQKGFCHVEHATPEEIKHASNQSVAQGKLMIRYGIGLRRRAHQAIA